MTDPLARVLQAFPARFFAGLIEHCDAEFATANNLSKQHFESPEQPAMRGQIRHGRLEAGFREAASNAGLNPQACYTKGQASRFSVVGSEGVYLLRSNVQAHCGPPRPAHFRKEWAQLNEWLDPFQPDLLEHKQEPPSDRLCGMIVVSCRKNGGDPTVADFVGLGIPRSDLSSWVVLEPLTGLLALYHDMDARRHASKEIEVQIKDKAKPKLKRLS